MTRVTNIDGVTVEEPASVTLGEIDCGGGVKCSTTELSAPDWILQCENDKFAMFCNKDNDKRCACKKDGKYYWTFGVNCKDLDCYAKNCKG